MRVRIGDCSFNVATVRLTGETLRLQQREGWDRAGEAAEIEFEPGDRDELAKLLSGHKPKSSVTFEREDE